MKNAIPILTPLRGIAALCVVFFHARLILFPQWMTPLQNYTHFIENSYLWVDLFFILSGFVMMHVYANAFSRDKENPASSPPSHALSWGQFMWLRFSRIYPLFFITLVVSLVWESVKSANGLGFYGGALFESWGVSGIPAFDGPFNRFDALLPNLFMLHGITETDLTWNISSWSLSVEWLSYMVFPFLVPLLLRKKLSYLTPLLFIAGLCVVNASKGSLDATGGVLALLRALSSFVLGAWLQTVTLSPRRQQFFNHDITLLVVMMLSLGLLHLPTYSYHNVIVVASFALLVFVAAQQTERKSPVFLLLDNKITRFLGDISYSLYLWHAVLLLAGIEIAHHLMPEAVALWYSQTSWFTAGIGALVFALVTIGLSALSYFYFEKPVMKWLRARMKKAPTSSSAAA